MTTTSLGRRLLAVTIGLTMALSAQTLWPLRADAAAPPPADNPSSAVTADVLPTAQINGVVWDQAVVGTTVYAVGEFTSARPPGSPRGQNESPRANLMAYDLTTGALKSWAPLANGRVRTVTASPDGSRLYVGGSFTSINGTPRWRVAAFRTSDGALDTSFAPIAGSDVFAIAATNSRVYLGGWFNAVNNVPRTRLAAVAASDGALLDWNPSADYTVYGMGLTDAEDRVVVSGSFSQLNGSAMRSIGSLDAVTGSSYPFAAALVANNVGDSASLTSLKVVNDQAFTTGFAYGSGNIEGVLVADAYSGAIQNLVDCHGDTYDSTPMNGVVYSVSHHHMCSNSGGYPEISPRRYFHADGFTIAATGTVNRNTQTGGHYVNFEGQPTGAIVNWYNEWTPGSYTGINQAGWTAESTSDYLLIGGEFLAINGIEQQGLVRFGTRNVVASPRVGPAGLRAESAPVLQTAAGHVKGNFRASYDRDNDTLTYRVIRADKGEANPVATMTAVSNPWTRPTLTFLDLDVIPGWSYQYYVIATDPDGNSKPSDPTTITVSTAADPYASAVATDGAEHYWRLGQARGTSTAPDVAGSRPLTLLSGATGGQGGALAGVSDTATSFSGTSTGTSGTAGVAIPGPQQFSIETWFKTTTRSGGKLVGFGSSATGNSSANDRNLYMNNAGQLSFGVNDGSRRSITSSGTYRDGGWHHAVATLSPAGMKLYVDGTLVASNASVTSAEAVNGYWRVGGDRMPSWPNMGSSNYFAGTLDEVAIYPTELSAAQVQGHYAAASSVANNQVPTAAFTATPTGLSLAVDGTTSTDNDGSIAAYGWEFGDGGRAMGPTATHEYGAPGTYTVKLTVVDDKGGVDTHTTAVTIDVDGSADVIAKDTFNRAGARWGSAAVGGAWTDSGASFYSTNGAQGVVTLARGGQGPTASLAAVSARDVSIRTDVALDKVPAGGVYLHQVLARVNGSSSYKLTARFEVGGALRLVLAKKVGTVETTLRSVTVPGYTYTAGERLNLRFDVWGESTAVLEAKVWKVGDPEPVVGQAKITDATPALASAGSVGITSYTGGQMSSVPLLVTVDDFQVDAFLDTNAPPAADFTEAADGLAVSFDASASASSDADGTIASYAWDFGDGATGTGARIDHTYGEGGTYAVTLTVTDDDGAASTYTKQVTVVKPNALPTATIGGVQTDELTATLDGSGSSDPDGTITSYAWDLGDGSEADTPTVTHTYEAAGTYTVQLLVTDDRGGVSTATTSVTVGPNQAPTSSFSVSAQDLVVAVDGSGSSDPDGSVVSYGWAFGDGGSGTGVTASHTYAAAGTYDVVLTVTDDKGATATSTRSVTVVAAPPVDPAVVARDGFSRTGSGWGAAEVGGSWTMNVASSFSTDGSVGKVLVPAGGTRMARLDGVQAKDVDILTDVALDKAPAGGTYLHQVLARVNGTSQYTMTVRLEASGALRATLSRTVGGVETSLRSTLVNGFNYGAGERLNLRFTVVGEDLRGTVWRVADPEPTTATVQATDATPELQAAGAVALKFYAGATMSNAPLTAAIDHYSVMVP